MALAATVQPTDRLLVQLQRPRQREPHHPTAAVLEVQPVSCRRRVRQQHLDLAGVPVLYRAGVTHVSRVLVAAQQLVTLGDVLIPNNRGRALVLVQQVCQRVELVRGLPVRLQGVHEPAGHLLELLRDDRCVLGDGLLVVAEFEDEVLPHRLVVGQVHRQRHLDRVQRRQRVGVDPRLQHIGGRSDAVHDLLQRPRARLVLDVVPAQEREEVLLLECALAAAQQLLIDDLHLTEDVLQAVAGEAAGQAPPHVDVLDDLLQRLEAFAAGVLQPRQLVEHDAGEARQVVVGEPLQIVIVRHHHVRLVVVQRRHALVRRADRHPHAQVRCPPRGLGWPDRGGHAQRGDDEPAGVEGIVHGRERRGGLARAHWREQHRSVAFDQELRGSALIRPQLNRRSHRSTSFLPYKQT